jgi:hypothetical protein
MTNAEDRYMQSIETLIDVLTRNGIQPSADLLEMREQQRVKLLLKATHTPQEKLK